MFCEKCGKPLDNDAAFCDACGAKVESGEPLRKSAPKPAPPQKVQRVQVCPLCGAELEEDCTFCTECGKALSTQPATPAPPKEPNIPAPPKEPSVPVPPKKPVVLSTPPVPPVSGLVLPTGEQDDNSEDPPEALDFSKSISFFREYVKNPGRAVYNAIESNDFVSVIICAVLYIVTGSLIQMPLIRGLLNFSEWTFVFGFIFAVFALALPFGISLALGIINKKVASPMIQIKRVLLNTPFVSVWHLLCIMIGFFSKKMWGIALIITALVYAVSMHSVVEKKLPYDDTTVRRLEMLLSAICWILLMVLLVVIEVSVCRHNTYTYIVTDFVNTFIY